MKDKNHTSIEIVDSSADFLNQIKTIISLFHVDLNMCKKTDNDFCFILLVADKDLLVTLFRNIISY